MHPQQQRMDSLRQEWNARLKTDKELYAAWENITQSMFQGTVSGLFAAGELIGRMSWWDGIAGWIEFSEKESSKVLIASHIHVDERPLYAFVTLHVRSKAFEQNEHTWFHTLEESVDWERLSILAGSVPMLGEIPDWLLEPLILGAIDEVDVPSTLPNILLKACRYPVTQILYETITEQNPSECLGWVHPVDNISWIDAIHFCNALSTAIGYDPVYQIAGEDIRIIDGNNGYRLPTEVEWVLAANPTQLRGRYAGSTDLWKVGIYDNTTSESVGRFKSNAIGIYDICGNVWEWCWSTITPFAPRKGGSWMSKEEACTLQHSSKRLKDFRHASQGLRLFRYEFTSSPPSSPTTTSQTRLNNQDENDDGWDW